MKRIQTALSITAITFILSGNVLAGNIAGGRSESLAGNIAGGRSENLAGNIGGGRSDASASGNIGGGLLDIGAIATENIGAVLNLIYGIAVR